MGKTKTKGGYQIMKWKVKDWEGYANLLQLYTLSNKETQIEGLAQSFTLQAA